MPAQHWAIEASRRIPAFRPWLYEGLAGNPSAHAPEAGHPLGRRTGDVSSQEQRNKSLSHASRRSSTLGGWSLPKI
jgi:hypothetical protein